MAARLQEENLGTGKGLVQYLQQQESAHHLGHFSRRQHQDRQLQALGHINSEKRKISSLALLTPQKRSAPIGEYSRFCQDQAHSFPSGKTKRANEQI